MSFRTRHIMQRSHTSSTRRYYDRIKTGECLLPDCGGHLSVLRALFGTKLCYCENCGTNHYINELGDISVI
jgi:hypothetical protein